MQLEFDCPQCHCHFASFPETATYGVLDRVTEEGPWCALGDGETFEDTIFAAFTTGGGATHCPACGASVPITEEALGRLSQEMLACW